MEHITVLITDDLFLTPSPSRCTFFPGFSDYVPGASAQNMQPQKGLSAQPYLTNEDISTDEISSFMKVTRLGKVPEQSSDLAPI